MGTEESGPQAFVERVLALLEQRFHGSVQVRTSPSAEQKLSTSFPTCIVRGLRQGGTIAGKTAA